MADPAKKQRDDSDDEAEEQPTVIAKKGPAKAVLTSVFPAGRVYAPHESEHALILKNRSHPREVRQNDALVRAYRWGGLAAFECRHPVTFLGEDDGPTWDLACCKTFFTRAQLARHWRQEHEEELPEEVPEWE